MIATSTQSTKPISSRLLNSPPPPTNGFIPTVPTPLDFAADSTSRPAAGLTDTGHDPNDEWYGYGGGFSYPIAVKIATGKINAVTGEEWEDGLHRDPQDYVVLPEQPWLDGYCVEKGVIRQFVAMPLGSGYSAEEQITGAAEHGGVQIIAYPMKVEAYERGTDEELLALSGEEPLALSLAARRSSLARRASSSECIRTLASPRA